MSSGAGPAAAALLHCSRIGAAHRRQGRPCQDFSLSRHCRDAAGQPVLVLAVADGHGGARYRRSDRGSRLACELAVLEVERALGSRAVDGGRGPGHGQIASGIAAEPAADRDLEDWRRWLAHELPEAIHRRWLDAIAADWERDPDEPDPDRSDRDRSDPDHSGRDDSDRDHSHPDRPDPANPAAADEAPEAPEGREGAFSPVPYGTTLGLVVIGPRWWGHTGLGDWDLVRVEAEGGGASLISEEPAELAAGEATCSLCQRQAARLFAPRSGLYPRREGEHLALVLSSDGIRKSCATDADFLALAAHLAAIPAGATEALAGALDQISREGSGDDVSVAIAQLGGAQPGHGPGLPEPSAGTQAKPDALGPNRAQGPDPGQDTSKNQDQDHGRTQARANTSTPGKAKSWTQAGNSRSTQPGPPRASPQAQGHNAGATRSSC